MTDQFSAGLNSLGLGPTAPTKENTDKKLAPKKRVIQRILSDKSGNIARVFIDLNTRQLVQPNEVKPEDIVNKNPVVEHVDTFHQPDRVTAVTKTDTGETIAKNDIPDHPSWGIDSGATKGVSSPQRTADMGWQGVTKGPSIAKGSIPNAQTAENQNTQDTNKAGFVAEFGQHRPNMPSDEITDKVRMAAQNVLGPGATIKGVSGTENPGEQYGSNRHKTGKALDFQVIDPAGNVVTDDKVKEQIAQAASELGVQGIGAGHEYMGDASMHFDTVDPSTYGPGQDSGWGSLGNKWQGELDAIRNAPPSGPAVSFLTPQDKPQITTPDALTPATGDTKNFTTVKPDVASAVKTQAVTPTSVTDRVPEMDITKASPADFSARGFGPARSKYDIDRMAYAIAGEMSGASLQALKAGDEKAKKEVADIAATMENRAQSKQYATSVDPIGDVLGAYDSVKSAHTDVTNASYKGFGSYISSALNDMYAGQNQPGIDAATHYYNPEISDPSWGLGNSKFSGLGMVGGHQYGSLRGEYTPDRGNRQANIDRYATARFGEDANSPTEGSSHFGGGSGLGYSANGGSDSPSEGNTGIGGSRYGGGSTSYSGNGGLNSPGEGNTGIGGSRYGGSSSTPDKEKDNMGGQNASNRSGGAW